MVRFRTEPAYEYVDVDLEQQPTESSSRWDADLTTRFSRRVTLRLPFVSAAMDTVTRSSLAIAMAECGGLGVLDRALPAREQAEEVENVKRATHFVIEQPYMLTLKNCVSHGLELIEKHGVGGIIIVDDLRSRKVVGVVSRRDLSGENSDRPLREIMNAAGTKQLVVAPVGTSRDEASAILHENRIEKLPLVDDAGHLRGVITEKDIAQAKRFPHATRDASGRLAVGAAIGVKRSSDWRERAEALVDAGTDVLVIDVAHGGQDWVLEATKILKVAHPNTDIVVGNVMTAELTKRLIAAGADGVKVGIAPGYACRTRMVTGVGGGQLTVVLECAEAALEFDVPICADGGIREHGDIGKALAAGAATVMMGAKFAGTKEAPGDEFSDPETGHAYKWFRGMASSSASVKLHSFGDRGEEVQGIIHAVTPEGADNLKIPLRGSVRDVLRQMELSLRATMSYIGARTVTEMPQKAVFRAKARSGA